MSLTAHDPSTLAELTGLGLVPPAVVRYPSAKRSGTVTAVRTAAAGTRPRPVSSASVEGSCAVRDIGPPVVA